MKRLVEEWRSVRNDPPAERNFVSSVEPAGRRHVGELGHSVGDTPPYLLAIVIILCRKFIGTRGAFLERFVTITLSMRLAARQMSISSITLGILTGNCLGIGLLIIC